MVLSWDQTADTQPTVGILPITFDEPSESNQLVDDVPLVYQLGNEYFLKRIVGKVLVSFETPLVAGTFSNNVPAAQVTCGFFIARAGDGDDPNGGANVPIGFGNGFSYLRDYNPDIPDAIREPWIWRRQWILGSARMRRYLEGTADGGTVPPQFWPVVYAPPGTWGYGSVADGPHLDAKTKRKVGNDDRLWWAMSFQPYPRPGATFPYTGAVIECRAHLDYRIFGSLRKARNRGTF